MIVKTTRLVQESRHIHDLEESRVNLFKEEPLAASGCSHSNPRNQEKTTTKRKARKMSCILRLFLVATKLMTSRKKDKAQDFEYKRKNLSGPSIDGVS